jgi:hypothetical protein
MRRVSLPPINCNCMRFLGWKLKNVIALIIVYMQTCLLLFMEIDPLWPIDSPRGENHEFFLGLLQGMEFLAGGFTPYVKTGLPPRIGGLRYEDPIHAQRVAKFHIFSLRVLVDNWIESGREGTYEDVRKRHLSDPMMEVLMHWSSARQPELSFQRWDGAPSLYMQVGRDHNPENPFRNSWDTAILLFARLLDSPYRYRIAKCRSKDCTYYYMNRIPRGPLQYGTYCPQHRQTASATRSEYRRRDAMLENRIQIAHPVWGAWPSRCRTEKSQREWIVSEVNRRQSKSYPDIKVNWVSRHLQEISSGMPQTNQNEKDRSRKPGERN